MPRKPRFHIAGLPVHVVQRGNNRQAIFFDQDDHRTYLNWLKEGSVKFDCAIHAYVLMTNHVHLLATPRQADGISRMMQFVGRQYVPYINHTYGRTGTLWEGRYKSSLIDAEAYFLICSRYIEMNPVRASVAGHPREYELSSYRANAEGAANGLLTPHAQYLGLGANARERQRAYAGLFRAHVDAETLSDIRASWQTGTPLGNDRFREQIEAMLKHKVGQARRGRPRKHIDDAE